jgi:hypothetical protein
LNWTAKLNQGQLAIALGAARARNALARRDVDAPRNFALPSRLDVAMLLGSSRQPACFNRWKIRVATPTDLPAAARGEYSGIVQGFSTPPLLLLIILMTNKRSIMAHQTNSIGLNVLGWITVLAIFAASDGLVVTWLL